MFHRLVHKGGAEAGAGIYLSLRSGQYVGHKGGPLPGTRRDNYLRVPPLLMPGLGLLAGGLYIIVMPFIGGVLVAYVLAKLLVRTAGSIGDALLLSLPVPGWMPGKASFLGYQTRRRKNLTQAHTSLDKDLEKLTRDLEKRGRENNERE